MAQKYIHQQKAWPQFGWDETLVFQQLVNVRNRQGRLTGKMEAVGFALRSEAHLKTLTLDVLKTSEIEGEIFDAEKVRSSIARKLGMDIGGLVPTDRHVDGVVSMMLDAVTQFNQPLSKERLLAWQANLFPTGYSGLKKIKTGDWRDDRDGPMRVVSGPMGRETVHFIAPEAKRLKREMKDFMKWFNASENQASQKTNSRTPNGFRFLDPTLKAAIAHLWFVTIHPFDDGNGRIARVLADMQLARADGSSERFYSMSVQIRQERNAYYEILEKTQKSSCTIKGGAAQTMKIDITPWLIWFLSCLDRALDETEKTLAVVFEKARFWERHSSTALGERQRQMINRLFEGFEGKLTTSKWAKITKCSQDTALRDIIDLIEKGILRKDPEGGRSTGYSLKK